MITPNFKFVSYLGGSAGDLFVASMNNSALNLVQGAQANKNSIKPYEKLLQKNPEKINEILSQLNPGYVSTHLFSQLIDQSADLVSVVVKEPEIQQKIIFRQMHLQRLRIDVAPEQSFFKIVKKLCDNHNYSAAAKTWFRMADQLWHNSMQHRLQDTRPQQLVFDKLFNKDFAADLYRQGWRHNIDQLQQNHQIWLEKNCSFSYLATLTSIEQKLQTMDWSQQTGQIQSDLFSPI
jgi:hypothetical protein